MASEEESQINWPPRSPFQALMSSPSGRKKFREYQNRRSLHSPLKNDPLDEDEDEDEETLRLKLEAIQAKLKLRKLKKAKEKKESVIPVQVPLSPTRQRNTNTNERSPGRILLGIDKGLKAKDVSLQRPRPRRHTTEENPFLNTRARDVLSRASNYTCTDSNTSSLSTGIIQSRKSFSSKLVEARASETERHERLERLKRKRSTGFAVDASELAKWKAAAKSVPSPIKEQPEQIQSFTREEILQSCRHGNGRPPLRTRETPAFTRRAATDYNYTSSEDRPASMHSAPEEDGGNRFNHRRHQSATAPESTYGTARGRSFTNSFDTPTADPSLYEPLSNTDLSKRILPHSFLLRNLDPKEKTHYLIPDLLRIIKGPEFDPPPCDTPDFVVFGIIASKSSPLAHKQDDANDSKRKPPGKFMALTLTDLKYELSLYLFQSAFNRYWKLTPGTVVAILNPTIMPPPPRNASGRSFALALSSDGDTVLEIGTSRNLGHCHAIRKDGKQCGAWIDRRHTEFCEFHVDVQVRKTKASRMELSTGTSMYGPGGKATGRTGFLRGNRRGEGNNRRDDGLSRNGVQTYDRVTGTTFYVAPRVATGAATSDDPFINASFLSERIGRDSKEERTRKRLAEREKEREIARKLGESASTGGGIGAEYLRQTIKSEETPAIPQHETNRQIQELMQRRGEVRLSPLHKHKRPHLDIDLRRIKKTRFVTSGGIKEAGRDSLNIDDDDDDDDDLEIV